ncbi:hypothetical protein [Weissella thailandensis]|uniref:Uncharacterized protein n=1 Tax=Weissella thailandensis TaxID=89061 RepID=A0ABX9I6D8_9LACO|nr:hypothetical protein [Weissella thailandensis]NKY90026.1 hypothetical protein [Weissella thailandensis]RDS59775.1 hypothetical protein DWV05_04240 [Weissella thailandensis]GEP74159.1 hypothetical protein WTH01_04060 [Weissella thailandensis]
MQTLSEFRQKLQRENQNRIKYLRAKFKNYADEDLDEKVSDELRGLINVTEILNHEPPKKIAVVDKSLLKLVNKKPGTVMH